MPQLKYTGPADVRKINKDDFAGVGVEDQSAIIASKKNNFVVEVNDSAAEYLLREESDFWSEVEASEPKK
jgi:hypothetical protein